MDDKLHEGRVAATEPRLDVVLAALELLEAGEASATAVLCDPDFELRWTSLGRLPRSHRGPDALTCHYADLALGRDEMALTCERVTSAGDRVLAYYAVAALGPGDLVVESRQRALVRVRNGRLRRWEAFQDGT
jgi:ketosteroid isomerase-like protein